MSWFGAARFGGAVAVGLLCALFGVVFVLYAFGFGRLGRGGVGVQDCALCGRLGLRSLLFGAFSFAFLAAFGGGDVGGDSG